MYTDYKLMNRESWKYPYKGKDLLSFAKIKLAEFIKTEEDARQKKIKLLKDGAPGDDEELGKLTKIMRQAAEAREKCEVFVHEFERAAPDRIFQLEMGDITFFGLEKSNGKGVD